MMLMWVEIGKSIIAMVGALIALYFAAYVFGRGFWRAFREVMGAISVQHTTTNNPPRKEADDSGPEISDGLKGYYQ